MHIPSMIDALVLQHGDSCTQFSHRYLIYPFALKCPSASSVLLNTFVAVSVMKGDGIPLHAQTTSTSLPPSKAWWSSRSTPDDRPGFPLGSCGTYETIMSL